MAALLAEAGAKACLLLAHPVSSVFSAVLYMPQSLRVLQQSRSSCDSIRRELRNRLMTSRASTDGLWRMCPGSLLP